VLCERVTCHSHQNHMGTCRFLFNCVDLFPITVVCLGLKATQRIHTPSRISSALSNQRGHVARDESYELPVASLRPEFGSDGAPSQLPDLDNWVSGHIVTRSQWSHLRHLWQTKHNHREHSPRHFSPVTPHLYKSLGTANSVGDRVRHSLRIVHAVQNGDRCGLHLG